jgi:hypothetical protein
VVAESEDEQDTIVNQRRHFIRSGGERPGPRHAKITGIGPVDLFERAETEIVIGTPPGEPFAVGRVDELPVR